MQINLSAENINVSILNSKGEVIFSHQNQGYQTVIDVAGLIKEGKTLGMLVKSVVDEAKGLNFPDGSQRATDVSGV